MSSFAPQQVAVIDIGKTNAKVVLFDLARAAEITAVKTTNVPLLDGLYPHHDIDALWQFIVGALRELAASHSIDAISIATHGATCALLDADGNLALPVLDYEHTGPQKTAAAYDEIRPPFSETGSPRLPLGLNLGAQLYWQAHAFAEQFSSARLIMMYPQYWAYRLCGVAASEVTSLGCHTDLWCPSAGDYSSLVDRMGLRHMMPPLHSANSRLGNLLPALVTGLGLTKPVPVFCGIHDSNASLYPHLLAQKPPFSVVSTGTWVVAMAIGGENVMLDPKRDTVINVDARGNPIPSARFMGGREYQIAMQGHAPDTAPAELDFVIAPDVMLLPSIIEGCGPFPRQKTEWRNAAGISAGQRSAAVSCYLSLMTATCLELIGAKGLVLVEGPFASNEIYCKMLASACGRPVHITGTQSTGTTFGASLLASPEGLRPSSGKVVTPQGPAAHGYCQRWKTLAQRFQ